MNSRLRNSVAAFICLSIVFALSVLSQTYGVTPFQQTTSTTTDFYLKLIQSRGLAGYTEYIASEDGTILKIYSKGGNDIKSINSKKLTSDELINLRALLENQQVLNLQSENCFLASCPLDDFVWRITVALHQKQYSFSCRRTSFWLSENNCTTASLVINEELDNFFMP